MTAACTPSDELDANKQAAWRNAPALIANLAAADYAARYAVAMAQVAAAQAAATPVTAPPRFITPNGSNW